MGNLDGRIAIITGAGNGIGREHAHAFAREGASVVVNDPGVEPDGSGGDIGVAESVVKEITRFGGTAVASTDSVAHSEGAQRVIETAVRAFGDLHVLVNNAAILRNAPFLEMTEDDFTAVLDVHLKGTFAMTQQAGRHWRAQAESGAKADRSIINTSSGSGLFNPLPTQANYAAAKAGVAAISTVAALELRRYGVRVNCFAPSAHRTRLTVDVPGVPMDTAPGRTGPNDPGNSSALVGYLATADCPVSGQVFRVYDRAIGIAQGWSISEEVRGEEEWTVGGVGRALAAIAWEAPEEPLMRALGMLDDPEKAHAALRAFIDGSAG